MQQNIDQLFKDGVESLHTQPAPVARDPQASWDRIEGMLGTEKKKRRGAWIWVSAAASVALLIALGWGLSRPGENGLPTGKGIAMVDSVVTHDKPAHQSEQLPATKDNAQQEQQLATAADEPTVVVDNGRSPQGQFKSEKVAKRKMNPNTIDGSQLMMNGITIIGEKSERNYESHTSSMSVVSQKNIDPQVTGSRNMNSLSMVSITNGRNKKANSNTGGKAGVKSPAPVANGTYKGVPAHANDFTDQLVLGRKGKKKIAERERNQQQGYIDYNEPYGSESYAETVENDYFKTVQEPLSTFSIDVDRASYTNHRRFIDGNALPPKYAVRVEEFINYFPYEYQPPHNGEPFSILPEVTTCPWNSEHKLVRIALKGREVSTDKVPASNIVFLLDVSGSMASPDKLPLLKQALTMLTEQLREQDKVSIVVYAGAAGLVLPPTSGNNKQAITDALNRLEAGGSTAGGQGIELAYATAKQNFMREGNNRVILATDGDFNVGVSDNGGLEELIVRKRAEGVFLSVLGFGEGNLQDSKMELLADKGNGNYNYIDGEKEAKKVLVTEFGGTLLTIAKDVKIQVEFNPDNVQAYRLIGYENRKLKNEDFANDKIDAGELGAGHTVTAFYEIVPRGAGSSSELKYQQSVVTNPAYAKELLTVKLRYKEPNGTVSKLLEETLKDEGRNITQTSNDFRWAVAVAAYGMILRQSDYKGTATLEQVLALAKTAVGADKEGYRKEFIELVTKAANITQTARGN